MAVEMNQMPDTARVWVYQADRPLTQTEIQQIDKAAEQFTAQWAAHGKSLVATHSIEYSQFLIFAVDESHHNASGCSIDSSVQFVREIENALGVSFLDRSKIAILEGDEVLLKPLTSIKASIEKGEITPKSKVVNNAVSTLKDWKDMWIQPAEESWMKRFF
jgi:hypothetical protein